MRKHTTGPWEISGGALRIFSAKTNEPIAFVLGCTPEDGLSPTPEKAVANARLISSAPDLLAALEEINNIIFATGAPLGSTEYFSIRSICCDAIKRAQT